MIIGTTLDIDDMIYLGRVGAQLKTDTTPILPQLTTICPECDETPEPEDGRHITLNTHVGSYWAERGEIDPLGMDRDDRPYILIACQGYHVIRFDA